MPPNTREEVKNKRGEEKFWANTPFATPTHWTTEVDLLKEKKIPVHTFFVDDDAAEEVFRKIATRTAKAGEAPICEFLNVKAASGAMRLKTLVCERVAYDVGENSGKSGNLMVDTFRRLKGEGNLGNASL